MIQIECVTFEVPRYPHRNLVKKVAHYFVHTSAFPLPSTGNAFLFSSFYDENVWLTFLTCLSKDNLQVLLYVEELELEVLHSQDEIHNITSSVSSGKASRLRRRSEKAHPQALVLEGTHASCCFPPSKFLRTVYLVTITLTIELK